MTESVAESPVLHATLKPLEWLVGCWKTIDGFGHYPTIKDFHYVEQLEFFHVGQPNLQFMQVILLLLFQLTVACSRSMWFLYAEYWDG